MLIGKSPQPYGTRARAAPTWADIRFCFFLIIAFASFNWLPATAGRAGCLQGGG